MSNRGGNGAVSSGGVIARRQVRYGPGQCAPSGSEAMKICPECLERVDEDLEFCPHDGTELRTIHAREEDPMEGRVLDEKWVVETKIGGGGMGAVYRGHQLSVDRTVAIKILRSDLSEDDEHVERFFREANVASNVSDPRCVTIYDFGQTSDDHVLYLAMEYLDGESLHDFRESDSLTLGETAEIGIEIATALEKLHGDGIVHRDLKPENVFLVDEVGSDLFLKLLDFGLAKVAQSEATPVTATGQVFGTPEFMSPEQCMDSDVGPKSDLYSLGCLLYELIAGRTPFRATSSVEMLLAHVNRPAPPIEFGVVPRAYTELIAELLAKEPEDRPESSVAVRRRLEAIRGELGEAAGMEVPISAPGERFSENPESETAVEGSEAVAPERLADPSAGESAERPGAGERGLLRAVVAVAVGFAGLAVTGYLGGWFVGGRAAPGASSVERGMGVERAVEARVKALVESSAAASGVGRGEAVGGRATFLAGATTLEGSRSPTGEGAGSESSGPRGGGRGLARGGTPSNAGGNRPAGEDEEEPEQLVPFLTESSATRRFRSKRPAVHRCVMGILAGRSGSEMLVRVELIVSGTGEVQSAEVLEPTGAPGSFRSCVLDVVRTLEFPPTTDGNGMQLVHDYTYRPSGGERAREGDAGR